MNIELMEKVWKNLCGTNFVIMNLDLVKYLGATKTIFLTYLLNKHEYHIRKNEVDEQGYFYLLQKDIIKKIGFSTATITRLNKQLEKEKLIKIKFTKKKNQSSPKNYYLPNYIELIKITESNQSKSKRRTNQIDRHINNNIRVNNIRVNKLTKVNIGSDEPQGNNNGSFFKSKHNQKIISYWNGLKEKYSPAIPLVKTDKPYKQIKELEILFGQLKKHIFLENNSISPVSRRMNNIPLGDKIEFDYKKHLKNLALFYRGEYEPNNKSILPRTFLGLIYNPIGKSSWLMQAIYNPPEAMSDKIEVKDHHPKTTEFFLNRLNIVASNNGLKTKLIYGIKSIAEFQKRIPVKTLNMPKLNREFGSCLNLCKNYYDWLDHQDWIEEITPACINTKGKLWKMFIKEMEEEDCEGYKLQ